MACSSCILDGVLHLLQTSFSLPAYHQIMRIDPLATHPASLPARSSGPPPTVPLEDAFRSVTDGEVGSTRYPDSWKVSGARWAVPLHQPVVGHDGTIYQADDRKILALDPGSGREKFTIPGDEVGVPVRLGEQLVCCERQAIFAFDPVGQKRTWTVPLESGWGKKAAVSADGRVFAGDSGRLLALDGRTGQELWSQPMTGSVKMLGYSDEHQVAVAYNGTFGVESERKLCGFDGDGKQLWSTRYDEAICMGQKGPLFAVREKIFKLFGSSHTLRAIDPRSGRKLWSESANASTTLWSTPEGHVIVGDGRQLRLRDGQTGEIRWTFLLKNEPQWNQPGASLTLQKDEYIVTDPDGSMTGIDPSTGQKRWEEPSRGATYGGPAVTQEGVLVLKTDGQIKGLLPAGMLKSKRAAYRVEEDQDSVRLGSVQVRKRRTP